LCLEDVRALTPIGNSSKWLVALTRPRPTLFSVAGCYFNRSVTLRSEATTLFCVASVEEAYAWCMTGARSVQDLRRYFDPFLDAANEQPDEDGITWTSESDWAQIVRILFARLEHYGDNDMLYPRRGRPPRTSWTA
jgi:hypothetical protein